MCHTRNGRWLLSTYTCAEKKNTNNQKIIIRLYGEFLQDINEKGICKIVAINMLDLCAKFHFSSTNGSPTSEMSIYQNFRRPFLQLIVLLYSIIHLFIVSLKTVYSSKIL